MLTRLFKPKKTIREKVVEGFKKPLKETLDHLPHRPLTKKENFFNYILRLLLYISIFVSGYLVAKLHSLLNLVS